MKKLLVTFLMLCIFLPCFACLILFITDGKNILVANHEDWLANDAELSFFPSDSKHFGMFYFDFASEKTAQGGVNEKGLFFDGTRTPFAPYPANESKLDCHCYIWKRILAECSTVEDALNFIRKYRIPEIEEVHILLADKSGNSAVVGIYNEELQIHRRNGSYQLLTNFNLSNPSYGDEPPCTRFATADSMLTLNGTASVDNLRNILSRTHQDALTAYSNICNLSTGDVYVFRKANYQRYARFNLAVELRKGRHVISLASMFR